MEKEDTVCVCVCVCVERGGWGVDVKAMRDVQNPLLRSAFLSSHQHSRIVVDSFALTLAYQFAHYYFTHTPALCIEITLLSAYTKSSRDGVTRQFPTAHQPKGKTRLTRPVETSRHLSTFP
jgi:hypothetical protein